MSSALRSIFASFSIDTGSARVQLEQLNKAVSATKEAIGAAVGTLLGGFSLNALRSFVDENIELGSQLNDMSERLGIAADDLQRFQYAAGLAGVGSEEAGRALQFLNKGIGEALEGNKEAAKTFAELGVNIKDGNGDVRELGDVIPEVADAFSKMGSDQERTAKAMQLFGKSGAALIPLLKNGSGELAKMNAQFTELGLGISDDFIAKADEAGDTLDTMKLGLRALKSQIAVEFLPNLTEFTKKLSGWIAWGIKLTRQTHIVKEAWIGMGLGAAFAFAKIGVGWAKMLGLISGKGGLIKNLIGLGWLGLVIAGVAALYLIFEDLFVLFEGGDSLIGEVLDDLFGFGTASKFVDEVKSAFSTLGQELEACKPLVEEVTRILGVIWEWVAPKLAWAAKTVLKSWFDTFALILKVVRWVIGEVSAGVGLIGTLVQSIGEKLGNKTMQSLGGALTKTGAGISLATTGAASIPSANDRALGLADVHQSNRVHIEVKGGPANADTGRAVAGAIGNVFGDQNKQALAGLYGGSGDEGGDE